MRTLHEVYPAIVAGVLCFSPVYGGQSFYTALQPSLKERPDSSLGIQVVKRGAFAGLVWEVSGLRNSVKMQSRIRGYPVPSIRI